MLKELCTNNIDLPNIKYAAILGVCASKGARSPHLWNAAFQAGNIDSKMISLDLNSQNVIRMLNFLQDDSNFIGGAITTPYKEVVANWLGEGRLSKEALEIGAVNCIFRNDLGQLIGTNTDGEAACLSLQNAYGSLTNKSILQLGCGGAGKATSIYFANTGARVTICVRDPHKYKAFGKKNEISVIGWDQIGALLNKFDIIVNTTSVGSRALDKQDESPVTKDQVICMEDNTFIYDIVYDPIPTKLIALADERGLRVLDGGEMNLEQAALAFMYAIKNQFKINYEAVKEVMLIKKRQLDSQ
jgi:shikimate dehydrogenase